MSEKRPPFPIIAGFRWTLAVGLKNCAWNAKMRGIGDFGCGPGISDLSVSRGSVKTTKRRNNFGGWAEIRTAFKINEIPFYPKMPSSARKELDPQNRPAVRLAPSTKTMPAKGWTTFSWASAKGCRRATCLPHRPRRRVRVNKGGEWRWITACGEGTWCESRRCAGGHGKLQHWCGVQAISGSIAAPVLAFSI